MIHVEELPEYRLVLSNKASTENGVSSGRILRKKIKSPTSLDETSIQVLIQRLNTRLELKETVLSARTGIRLLKEIFESTI